MFCPTCSHTIQKIATDDRIARIYWCPRCGTVKTIYGTSEDVHVPKLVERCREFAKGLGTDAASGRSAWRRLGIEEAIYPAYGGRSMNILEALALCKSGHKVRPTCWRTIPSHWVEARVHGKQVVFVECGSMEEMAHALRLGREDEFLGEWEVVE